MKKRKVVCKPKSTHIPYWVSQDAWPIPYTLTRLGEEASDKIALVRRVKK